MNGDYGAYSVSPLPPPEARMAGMILSWLAGTIRTCPWAMTSENDIGQVAVKRYYCSYEKLSCCDKLDSKLGWLKCHRSLFLTHIAVESGCSWSVGICPLCSDVEVTKYLSLDPQRHWQVGRRKEKKERSTCFIKPGPVMVHGISIHIPLVKVSLLSTKLQGSLRNAG